MTHSELCGLYNEARNRHLRRRDDAIQKCRRTASIPGWCAPSRTLEQIREWFDGWESYLWETYRDAKSLTVPGADGEGDPCRPSPAD